MTFQINALPAGDFAALRAMTDTELAARNARRVIAEPGAGYPCRVSLADAAAGETLILLNHVSMPADTPYRASHAIYIREAAQTATPAPGEVPEALAKHLLSVRGFDAGHMMREADVVDGGDLAGALDALFADPAIEEAHIHNAKQGCYAARATHAPK